MNKHSQKFFHFIWTKENKKFLWIALIVSVIYFIVLRLLYPIPSYFADSFTYVGAAKNNQPISFRPVGYSRLLLLFKLFSTSDIALIAGQYFSNILVNLFLFFTFLYFFEFRKVYKVILFLLLIVNPFYLFYSNYVSPDSFFCCFTVLWFTLLIWTLHKPSWWFTIAQLVILALLFNLRYNAVILPVVMTLALLLSKKPLWKKVISIGTSYLLIIVLVFIVTRITKNYVGTKTFSAFSGWQMANNAVHILRYEDVDTSTMEDKEAKQIIVRTKEFFDTTKDFIPATASAWYLWHPNSPLKKYMSNYAGKKKTYFLTWNALGPVYNDFGKAIIIKKPFSYVQYFIIPNTKEYFYPKLEIYDTYFEDVDTIAPIARNFYKYKTKKTSAHRPALYAVVFQPWRYLFPLINVLFITLGLLYIRKRKYKEHPQLFNNTLLCFTAFYLINFFFIVSLAPSVLRYHIFIVTLSFPMLLYLIRSFTRPSVEESKRGVTAA